MLLGGSVGPKDLVHGSRRFIGPLVQLGAHADQPGVKVQAVLKTLEARILHRRGRLQPPLIDSSPAGTAVIVEALPEPELTLDFIKAIRRRLDSVLRHSCGFPYSLPFRGGYPGFLLCRR